MDLLGLLEEILDIKTEAKRALRIFEDLVTTMKKSTEELKLTRETTERMIREMKNLNNTAQEILSLKEELESAMKVLMLRRVSEERGKE